MRRNLKPYAPDASINLRIVNIPVSENDFKFFAYRLTI